jgi:hypothetical protein
VEKEFEEAAVICGFFYLQIIPRIPFGRNHILPHIPPESQHHVDNNGRTHRKDGSVHKILPDLTG